MYIEPLQVLTYFGGYPEPQNIPLIKQKHPLTSVPTNIISVKVICNPFPINNCLNNALLLTGLTHFVRKYNSFYIFHVISGFYTFITQIHFYLFIGGGKKWKLKNTTHLTEKISSHWLIFYTHELIKRIF